MLDMKLVDIQFLHSSYVLMKLWDSQPLPIMQPGQFIQVRVDGSPSSYLRRPISINFVDYESNELWLLVQTVGEGTKTLSKLTPGSLVNIILPLGNSFSIPQPTEKVLLIGGGVGVAPLLMLGKLLQESQTEVTFLLGARSANDLLELEYFERYGEVLTTTEDGSGGEKGYVTQHSVLKTRFFDRVYTCGPKPMMMAVAAFCKQNNIECEVSLENSMACGIGACLCCVEDTVDGHVCTCTEGPGFNIKKLKW
jgi:dihydroorotate dehydrogenase electron transfer subunit